MCKSDKTPSTMDGYKIESVGNVYGLTKPLDQGAKIFVKHVASMPDATEQPIAKTIVAVGEKYITSWCADNEKSFDVSKPTIEGVVRWEP